MILNNNYYIVRHGESENNVTDTESSKLENKDQFGLTQIGKETMEKEAKNYNDFDIIYTSPFRKAKETAKIFAEYSKCPCTEDLRLREVDMGDFELQGYAKTDQFRSENSKHIPFPNGESLADTEKRVIEFFNENNQKHKNMKILIVGHGGTIKTIFAYLNINIGWELYKKEYNYGRRVLKLK